MLTCPTLRNKFFFVEKSVFSTAVFFAGNDKSSDREHPGLLIDGKSVMVEWNESVMEKVLRFSQRDRNGGCPERHNDVY